MLPCQPEWNESFPSGPVAQLGARFHGMEEVIGSIPIRSTKQPPPNEWFSGSELPPPGTAWCHLVSNLETPSKTLVCV